MNKLWVIFFVVLATFFWGSTANAVKIIVLTVSPLSLSAVRFGLAALLLFIILLPQWRVLLSSIRKNYQIFFILGVAGIALGNGLFFTGLKYTSAINASLIMASSPIMTNIFSMFLFKTKITGRQKIGMCLSFIGIIYLVMQGSWDIFIHLRMTMGDLIVLVGTICWAFYSLLLQRYVKESTPLMSSAVTMGIGAAVLLIVAEGISPGLPSLYGQTSFCYLLIAYISIFGGAAAYVCWNTGIKHLGANRTSLFYNLVPLFTALTTLAEGGMLHKAQILGGSLVILGVLISMWS